MRLGSGLSKGLSIKAILGPTSGFFITNQFVNANDHHRLVPVGRRYSMLPGFLELDPIYDGDDVDSIRWETHLEDDAWS